MDRIYETAIELFHENGYELTTLIDIAREARVSTRTLYKYYPTKDIILRRFVRENILETKEYMKGLAQDARLFDRLVQFMVCDYEQMFCLFDPSSVLHDVNASKYSKVHPAEQVPFDMMNYNVTETFYYYMLADEQIKHGVEPGLNTRIGATIIMSQYRHVCDIYRFSHRGRLDSNLLQSMLSCRLGAIWSSIEHLLQTPIDDSSGTIDGVVERLPISERFLKRY